MCLAIPVRVVEVLKGNRAIGEQMGVKVEFSTALLEKVQVGSYVLVHTGIAIEQMDENEAQESLEIWRELQEHESAEGL